jgi:hypothetical protein
LQLREILKIFYVAPVNKINDGGNISEDEVDDDDDIINSYRDSNSNNTKGNINRGRNYNESDNERGGGQ